MISEMTSEWKEIGTAPIASDSPAGASVRYLPEFERLQIELQKLDSLLPTNDPAARIDWQNVIRLSKDILSKKSKDLVVAGFLCRALFQVEGYAGLLAGLECLQNMSRLFWDSLFPEKSRMRGRSGAVIWLSDKVGAAVSSELHRGSREELESCVALITGIETVFVEQLGEGAPRLTNLRDAIQEQIRNLESEQSVPQASNVSTASPPPLPTTDSIVSQESCSRALTASIDMMRRAASFARGQDSAQLWPYRIVRLLAWLEINALPSHIENETRIPPPAPHLKQQYELQMSRGAWKDVLHQVEDQIGNMPFWLDLHRCAACALSHLGTSHAPAQAVVMSEVAAFVRRFPEILQCRFADGTPFADEQTQQWIQSEMLPAREVSASPMPSNEADDCTDLRTKAQDLLQAGQVKDAMNIFVDGIAHAASPRRQFQVRLEFARLCMEAGHFKIALAHLEILDKTIQSVSLETWEPALAVEVLQTLSVALNRFTEESKSVSTETVRWAEVIYKRLCQLDVLGVLELEGRKKAGFFGRS